LTLAVGYHWSPEPLRGRLLLPATITGDGFWTQTGERAWRAGRVWMFATATAAFDFGGLPGVVHRVIPASDVELLAGELLDDGVDGYDEAMPAQFHASSAFVVGTVENPRTFRGR
jgi:hypothetical protein